MAIRDVTEENRAMREHMAECPIVNADPVNHPPHYNSSKAKCECGRRIECIDVTRHLGFNVGNAIKYLWRCELKNSTIEDFEIKNRVVESAAK